MKVFVDRSVLLSNIEKAKALAGSSAISVMLKSFYEYVGDVLPENLVAFSKERENTICYSIGSSKPFHKGAVVVDIQDAENCYHQNGIKIFYVPVDSGDNREGLTPKNAINLARSINKNEDVNCIAMITSRKITKNNYVSKIQN